MEGDAAYNCATRVMLDKEANATLRELTSAMRLHEVSAAALDSVLSARIHALVHQHNLDPQKRWGYDGEALVEVPLPEKKEESRIVKPQFMGVKGGGR